VRDGPSLPIYRKYGGPAHPFPRPLVSPNINPVTILGIDFAKNVFQLHDIDRGGHTVLKRRLTRDKVAVGCVTGHRHEACSRGRPWRALYSRRERARGGCHPWNEEEMS
jgi:hypothetical protein